MKNPFSKIGNEVKALAAFTLMIAFVTMFSSTLDRSFLSKASLLAQVGDTTVPPGDTTPPAQTPMAAPSAPTSLNATPNVCGSGTIYLSWPSVTGAAGYRLSRDGASISDGTGLSHPDSGLTAGTAHSYSLVAYNTGGDSSAVTTSASAPAACSTIVIPAIPSNLMVDGSPAPTSVKLKWTDNSINEDKFNIERKLTTANGYAYTVWTVGTDITSYTDTSAVPGTTYDYRVQACAGVNCSDYTYLTGIIVPTTAGVAPLQTAVPPAPTGFVASSGACGITSISLSWQASSGASEYRVYRGDYRIYTTTNLGYIDTSLPYSTTYSYKVYAYNSVGTSSAATASGATPAACYAATSTIPAAPTSLSLNGTVTATSIPLRWTDNSSNEDKFNIERKLSTSASSAYAFLYQIVGANVTTYTDNSVVSGVSYDYRIQACLSGTGCSAYAYLSGIVPLNTTTATTTGTVGGANYSTTIAPTVPTNLRASTGSCGDYHVGLSWSAASYASSYKIYRNGSSIGSTTALVYYDTSAAMTSNYYYTVFAKNAYGTSTGATVTVSTPSRCPTTATTTIVTATTTAPTSTSTVPMAPTSLSINGTPTASSISLRWTDNANNEDKFIIERKLSTSASSAFASLYQIIGANVTTFTDNTVAAGVSYDYGVQACKSGTGCSNYTYLLGVRTSPMVQSTSTLNVAVSNPSVSTIPTVPMSVAVNASSSAAVTATSSPVTIVQATTSPEIIKIQDISQVVDETKTAIDDAKASLIKIIDDAIASVLKDSDPVDLATTTQELSNIREGLLAKIDERLAGLTAITPEQILALKADISLGLRDIRTKATAQNTASTTAAIYESGSVTKELDALKVTIADNSKAMKAQGGDLLFKDTNKDGISDYDSKNVYHIDPIKPSPVSVYNGQTVTAGQKVLLGFDPKQTTLVRVVPEQPASTTAPVTSVYKVAQVKLTEDKKVAITGKALPNSYVTIYIYSTPTIVTVKANSDGEWQYTMDKELDSGQHTVYTASVNNSGKILARSQAFVFTKTAEAATLGSVPPVVISDTTKPGLFDNVHIYVLVMALAAIIVIILLAVGYSIRDQNKPLPQ